ncbi:mucin-2 [Cololabis saira]|uniref:mucin-2 n=1 Tax=Cololabis saira TaxID=129043 RepID=UPI002AD46A11|nr:mucin-2 [Cololabis saira]XP_061580955.1 mucin-2 [Cololabis saira]
MEKGHLSLQRGVSWSPGGLTKPLPVQEDMHTSETDYNASWEKTGFNKERTSRKTNLTRSASLSETELKENRVRSQIIAAQLTIPSNASSTSRGVQLFNRRKQRVSAFTFESGGQNSEVDKDENVKSSPVPNKLTWAERSSEEKDRELNFQNIKPLCSPPVYHSVGDIMEEPIQDFHKQNMDNNVIQERHFLPVKEEQEEEEDVRDEISAELEDNVKQETPGSNNADPHVAKQGETGTETNGGHTPGNLLNGCNSTFGPERMSLPSSKQTIINRTARPFFSPPTVRSPEAESPVMDIPSPPSYSTPPLPASTVPQPAAFAPLPPPPSYPTPPLPAFTNQPPQTFYSPPPPIPPSMSPGSPPPSISQFGPPTAPKPSSFVPQPAGERKAMAPLKTGILQEGLARRAGKKSMFTFKEKTVVAPNPELLSLVQGVDERKKHGNRSAPEPASEEELLALGAEASNFLVEKKDKAQGATAPEWASCLKSSRTRPRPEHQPEQTLSNVSGKGAELFTKRQSRMEKYVVENQNTGQIRSPSPTMSLPPSWVYASNMPGRVKAIAKSSDVGAQVSQNLKAQQAVRQKPKPEAAAPEPVPETCPLENGCSKLEMDLSRHRPYQINSSLFILNPVKDPLSSLPRGAPQAKTVLSTPTFSRQTSQPNRPLPNFGTQRMSPQLPLSPTGAPEYPAHLVSAHARISSPMSALSPERVSSPRSGVQAPRPTFSATKAGITPQASKESSPGGVPSETPTPTSTPRLLRRFSSPEGPATGIRFSCKESNQPSATISSSIRSVTSPVTSPGSTRSHSPMPHENIHFSAVNPTSAPRPPETATTPSPWSPPWGSRCQSPMVNRSSTTSSISAFKTPEISKTHSPISPPWSSRCQSPMASHNNKSPSASSFTTSRPSLTSTVTSPCSPPWGSRCQSPAASQNTQISFAAVSAATPSRISAAPSPACPNWGSRSQSPSVFQSKLSFSSTKAMHTPSPTSPAQPTDARCMSPTVNNLDSKANHRLLAKNIINAAKRKNSPSPGALSGHSLPISPVGNSQHDWHKPPTSSSQSRALGAQSPTFTSPPPTPTQRICSPVRLYNTRSLTDSDASVESEDSGLRSPGLLSYNTCPRGWGGSLRIKRNTVSTDL